MSASPTRPSTEPRHISACLADLAPHLAAMSRADGCPECLNTEPPRSAIEVENAWRAAYLCTDCGHAWTTDWRNC